MKIHLTKKEYRLLLDVFSISSWVMHAHKTEDDERTEPYRELEQKIMSYAKEYGFEDLIMYDRNEKRYFPTIEYEDEQSDRIFIEEFEEDVFWQELCDRLAQRDLIKAKGIREWQEMDRIRRITEEDERAEKYSDEFLENGLKNLIISRNKT